MRITVASLQFGERSYFSLSTKLLASYTAHHGYHLVIGDGGDLGDERDRRWGKLPVIAGALAESDLVLYLDADCVVNPLRPIEELLPVLGASDMLLGRDSFRNANTGVMLFRPAALDILSAWEDVPTHHPETANKWPVDELAFNKFVLPAFGDRIALPRRVIGTASDFVTGSFVRHFMNGDEASKLVAMATAVLG